jgi:hypothetical protein
VRLHCYRDRRCGAETSNVWRYPRRRQRIRPAEHPSIVLPPQILLSAISSVPCAYGLLRRSRRGRQSILVRINLRAADYRYSFIIIVLIARKRFHSFVIKARDSQGLEHSPVTQEAVGSSPVAPDVSLTRSPSTVLSKRLRAVLLPHCRPP